ncbi:MAG: hypothetical protein K2X91_09580, partial [Thermoleophilia bacterium]|nr:hypothetical protein [Thermoleophilia bacterium]
MNRRTDAGRRLALAGLLSLALAPSPAPADEPPAAEAAATAKPDPAAIKAGKALLGEGDRLADAGKTAEAVIKYKEGFEKLLPGMRKIPFKFEVKRDVTRREALRDLLIKEIDADVPAAEFRADELGMKALGFLPREADLKDLMVRIYAEEIAAFY